MAITTNTERMARTARQLAEVQRDSYEALAENLAASQKRTVGLAQDGIEFMGLQEANARAAQEWFADGLKLLQLQQRNAEFVQKWTSGAAEAMREQTEHNVRTAETFARGARKQQEGFRTLTQQWVGAYRDFFSPFVSYAHEGLRTAQQGLKATEQGLRVAEEATEQTEEVLRQTEKATRQAELQAAVFGALKTANYEELTVDEISKRLDGLSTGELKKVREFEKQNKNRETLIGQIDRKIKANS